jgi:ATP/maltotriose-dependent transcriptional regulator MalT/DNA-binding SARP family transcriptional activator
MQSSTNAADPLKFAPPSLDGTLPRRALLERLAAIPTPAKWLCAPSGSGKSTLVAAYARVAKRKVVWYRFDARDDDPGFFFPSFAAALAERLPCASLPHFSDGDQGHEEAFAARLFSGALTPDLAPALIVLDDVQRVSADWLTETLSRLVGQAPPGIEIVIVGDAAPAPSFFDAIVARRLALANDIDLRFSPGECAAVAQLLRISGLQGDEIIALTGGHAGAVVLACEFMRGARTARAQDEVVARQLHAHLLGKLVDRLPSELGDLLLRTASLPHLTAPLVEQLIGRPDAAELLDVLADRGLLIRFPASHGIVYETHGLVRAAAQTLAAKRRGADEARHDRVRCAEVLQANKLLADAYELWLELGDRDAALTVLEPLSERYARQRQPQLLLRAAQRLPESDLQRRPWIAFWVGEALLGVSEAQARHWFDLACRGFDAGADRAGMALASASVLIAFNTDLDDAGTVPVWLALFRAARRALGSAEGIALRGVFLLGVISETSLADAADAEEDQARAALDELIRLVNDPNAWPSIDQQLQAAVVMIEHARLLDSAELAQQIVLATAPLAETAEASALMRGRWWLAQMRIHHLRGDTASVNRCLAQVERLIEQGGTRNLVFEVGEYRATIALRAGELDEAAALISSLQRKAAGASQVQLANLSRAAAWLSMRQGRYAEALTHAEAGLRAAQNAGFSRRLAVAYEIEYCSALAANRDFVAASARAHEVAVLQTGHEREIASAIAYCLDYFAGGSADVAALSQGLHLAARASFARIFDRLPTLLAPLCERALALGIETEFVRKIIRLQRLHAPDGAGPAWPWTVRVWTLGGFRLEIRDAPYRPAHKAQDKPLELLKLLVAAQIEFRAGAEKGWLAERLWPDADEGNARKSLDMALARLRRLLDCGNAVEVVDGQLRLSDQHVWTDVKRLLAATGGADAARLSLVDLEAIVSFYGGEFLHGDDEAPWLLGARATLSRRFRAALLAAEEAIAPADQPRYMAALERALGTEPVAEDIARALMRMHRGRGEYAEALSVHRRLRDMLSIVLGVAPSARTEELRQQVYAAAEADAAARRPPLRDSGAAA